MKLGWTTGAPWGLAMHPQRRGAMRIYALLALIGVARRGAITYFKNRQEGAGFGPAAAAPAPGGDSEIDGLVREADRRLAHANAGATIANLPLIFVIGDHSTAKTSTVVNSGIEARAAGGPALSGQHDRSHAGGQSLVRARDGAGGSRRCHSGRSRQLDAPGEAPAAR